MIEQLKTIREFFDGISVPYETLIAFEQLEAMVGEQESSLAFYKRRCDALQQWQSKMRDPERTVVCDILANGHTLEPAGDRYAAPVAQQPQAEPDDETLKERDDAEDFIDMLLDEVLGTDRPEWTSAYGRDDALRDVQERMTALHKPTVDKAWDRFEKAQQPQARSNDVARTCPFCNEEWVEQQQAEAVPTFDEQLREVAKRAIPQQAEAVPPDVEVIRKALERAFIMGQNYWADADSESYSANKRSDVTRQKFNAMRDEVCAAIAQQKGN